MVKKLENEKTCSSSYGMLNTSAAAVLWGLECGDQECMNIKKEHSIDFAVLLQKDKSQPKLCFLHTVSRIYKQHTKETEYIDIHKDPNSISICVIRMGLFIVEKYLA